MLTDNFEHEFFLLSEDKKEYKKIRFTPSLYSNCNRSDVIEPEQLKYKFMYDNIPTQGMYFLLPKITYIQDNKKYCYNLFWPIKIGEDTSHTMYGRNINVKFRDNNVKCLSIYLTKKLVRELRQYGSNLSDEDFLNKYKKESNQQDNTYHV